MTDRFEFLKQEIVYQEVRGQELRWALTLETIRDTDTDTTFQRSLMRHPGVAAIVPITSEGEILLIEQFRYSAEQTMWEIPAGTLHGKLQNGRMVATESAALAAARELSEEAGFEAGRMELAQQFYVMPGTSDGLVNLFLAFELTIKTARADIGEVVTRVKPFTLERAIAMIASGEIRDAKTIIGIYCAKSYQERLK